LKTDASERTVPLPGLAVAALREHIKTYGLGVEGLVFTIRGAPISRSRLWELFHPVALHAGLNEQTGTGPHALRHFYASALIRSGASVKVVQERLGHTTAAETLDTYAHLWPDDDERTAAALETALDGITA